MKISLIVAVASNGVIGHNGQMPWHLSADLKRFKQITMGKPIIMGRKTFESIGKALPGRTNIIISHNRAYQQPDCLMCHDLESALLIGCKESNEVFVIGGSALFAATLPYATTLHLTEIHQEFVGDTYFPEWDRTKWTVVSQETVGNDPQVPFTYSFLILVKQES